MLDIAKIDSRALDLYPEPVLIPSLIELVCQDFAEAITERNLSLVVEDMTKLPAIEADPEALNKIFYHLIMNAIKYTPDRGTVTVSGYSRPEHESELAQESLEIVVRDTGIGIDPEFHELIFKKFYQTGELALHSSGKTKFKGAGPGLGLAIVQGIVEAHQGKVWVESPGYDEATCPGSQFHVLLPMRQNIPTDRPHPNPARSTKQPQILLKPGPYKF
jgi:signal transduction histidine kinase